MHHFNKLMLVLSIAMLVGMECHVVLEHVQAHAETQVTHPEHRPENQKTGLKLRRKSKTTQHR